MTTIALITGASGGVGQALVRELQQHGVTPVAVGRSISKLHDIYGNEIISIEADVSTPDGAEQALTACIEQVGLPTQLAHCAGSTLLMPLHRTDPAVYRAQMAANVDSAFFTLGAFVRRLLEAGQPGAAVLLSSVVARIGVANHEAIGTAKGAVEGLIRSAAASYAGQRIRINGVAPGILDTPANAVMLKNELNRKGAARQYPLSGIGDPAAAARVIGWLLSAQTDWITGQIWAVDGGFSAIRPLVK